MKEQIYVTASEIGEFVYCPRGWWLRFHGFLSEPTLPMIQGTKQHDSLALGVRRHSLITSASWYFIIFAAVLFIILLLYLWFSSAK